MSWTIAIFMHLKNLEKSHISSKHSVQLLQREITLRMRETLTYHDQDQGYRKR